MKACIPLIGMGIIGAVVGIGLAYLIPPSEPPEVTDQTIHPTGDVSDARLLGNVPLDSPPLTPDKWYTLAKEHPNEAYRRLLSSGYFSERYQVIGAIFAELASRDLEDAKSKVSAISGIEAQSQAWKSICEVLFITSPVEAVRLAREIRDRHPGMPYSQFLERWAKEAPDDVADYLESIAHESPYDHDILICLRAISEKDGVAAAFDWLNKHFIDSPDELRLQFLSEHASKHPEMFVSKASQLPNSFEKSNLFSNFALNFAREDPQFTLGWIQSIEDPMLRIQMAKSALRSTDDSSLAEALAEEFPSRSGYETAIRTITTTRMQNSSEQEVKDWIATLPDPEGRTTAATAFIGSLSYEDPKAASEYALAQETTPTVMIDRLTQVGKQIWRMDRDAVEQWIATLPEGYRVEVSEAVVPNEGE